MSEPALESYLTTDEAAGVLRLSVRHIYRLLTSKQLAALKSGRKHLIPKSAILAYIHRQTLRRYAGNPFPYVGQ